MHADIEFVDNRLTEIEVKCQKINPTPLDDEISKILLTAKMRMEIMKDTFYYCSLRDDGYEKAQVKQGLDQKMMASKKEENQVSFPFGDYAQGRAADQEELSGHHAGARERNLGITGQIRQNIKDAMIASLLPKEDKLTFLMGENLNDLNAQLAQQVQKLQQAMDVKLQTLDEEMDQIIRKAFIRVIESPGNKEAWSKENIARNMYGSTLATPIPNTEELSKLSIAQLSNYIFTDPEQATQAIEQAVTCHILDKLNDDLGEAQKKLGEAQKKGNRNSMATTLFRPSSGASTSAESEQKKILVGLQEEVANTERLYLIPRERPKAAHTTGAASNGW